MNDVGDEFFNHFKYTGIETFAVKLGALSSNGGWFWQALQAKEFDRAEQAPSNNWILLRVYGAANGQPFIVHVHSGYIEPPKVIQTSEDRSCFIAHAAFNDTLHPTVVELRRTRDEVLARSIVGRRFIQYYYKKSPKVAGLISERPAAQAAARLMLTPIAGGIRRARSISSRIRSLIK